MRTAATPFSLLLVPTHCPAGEGPEALLQAFSLSFPGEEEWQAPEDGDPYPGQPAQG